MEVLDGGAKIPRGSMGVWTLAWPSIITNLFYATSSIVAIKVVGNLGPDAIAAAVTGQRVTFILQAVLTGVLAGSTALICLLYTSPSPRDVEESRMPSSA